MEAVARRGGEEGGESVGRDRHPQDETADLGARLEGYGVRRPPPPHQQAAACGQHQDCAGMVEELCAEELERRENPAEEHGFAGAALRIMEGEEVDAP